MKREFCNSRVYQHLSCELLLFTLLVAIPSTAAAQVSGRAARDVSIVYGGGCYKITNFSARRIQVKQGIYITQLERGESKRGPCVTMLIGDTTATYLDSDPAPPARPAPTPPRVADETVRPGPTPSPRPPAPSTALQNVSKIRVVNLCPLDVSVYVKWHRPREAGWTTANYKIKDGQVTYLSYDGVTVATTNQNFYWYAIASGFIWQSENAATDSSRMIAKPYGVDTIVNGRKGISPPGTRDADITLTCEANGTPVAAS